MSDDPVADFSALYDVAEAINSSAWRALVPFTLSDPPTLNELDTFVSLNETPAECCDLVATWLVSYGPTAKSLALDARSASPMTTFPTSEGLYRLAFWSSCYPVVQTEGGSFVLPDPAVINERNRALYAQGLAIWCGVVGDYVRGDLFATPMRCPRLTFGRLTPLGPLGGCGGFGFEITSDTG